MSLALEDNGDLDDGRDEGENEIEIVPRIGEERLPVGEGSEESKDDLDIEGDRKTSLEVV